MGAFLTREAAEAFDDGGDGTEKSLPRAIEALSDEVRALSVKALGQGSRELGFLIAKLDEARLWADEYLVTRRTVIRVDKRDYARKLDGTADLETLTGSTVSTATRIEVPNV